MTVKLNLTVNEKTAAAIKKYAKRKRTSVSKIAEELFTKTLKDESSRKEVKNFIEKTAGMVKGLQIGNIKDELEKAIREKHYGKDFS